MSDDGWCELDGSRETVTSTDENEFNWIPNHVAIQIAFELKKLLIDHSLLDISQSDLEANLFKSSYSTYTRDTSSVARPTVEPGLMVSQVEPPKTGLDPAVIASLPVSPSREWKPAMREKGKSVRFCLSVLEDDEMARLQPNCKHTFHAECIDYWLGSQSTCPICRTEMEPRVVALELRELLLKAVVLHLPHHPLLRLQRVPLHIGKHGRDVIRWWDTTNTILGQSERIELVVEFFLEDSKQGKVVPTNSI
ncbi:hypothetical protein RHSIM_Rhsim06G0134300 [Rhododendron simsii]|uniref:RING-type E3 ubiquitin transferase n=1 Tax=Rhododendron simsii TaxID=118357 RepID=A0A834GRQ1_RHOSS|nr:hypothetical protein RHSIM_Rhsim06G0134300 [Rhododendron simsii]